MFTRKFLAAVSLFFCLYIFANTVHAAKSVYVINNQDGSGVQVYRIDGNQVQLQTTTYLPQNGSGAIALAVWPQKELLFATHEGASIITYVSTKTLATVGQLDIGISDFEFAGIVVDTGKGKIYAAQRGDQYLYVYKWDDVNGTLGEN